MPKKKTHCKIKPKQETEKGEFNENIEEDYTTIADNETNKKYNKRLIQNNWSKYEAKLPDFDSGDEDIGSPKTVDFSDLLRTASSDFSHFQFSSEKLWKSEHDAVTSSKIFNLDLNILSKGLACVPFYERVGLDVSELTVEEKERCDAAAKNSWEEYNLERKKLLKETVDDLRGKSLKSDSKTIADALTVKLDLKENNTENRTTDERSEVMKVEQEVDKNSNEEAVFEKNDCSGLKMEETKRKIFFSENDENLEDWLDSVLDD